MITLTPTDLPVGQPLPWSLTDGAGNLLLASGSVIPHASDLALVFRHGTVCRPELEAEPVQAPAQDGPHGLQLGALLHVQQEGEAARAAACRLIGFVEQGLFVTWPRLDGVDQVVTAGDTLALAGFCGQSLHAFQCTVTAVCRTPFRYLVLSAPRDTVLTPVRAAARVSTRLAAYLDVLLPEPDSASGSRFADATRLVMLCDLSTGGALVRSSAQTPSPGTRLRLRFRLQTASLDSEIVVNAWVRGPHPELGDEEFPAFGVAFDVLGEREQSLLQCFVYEQILAGVRLAGV
jgi:hypothetical protein